MTRTLVARGLCKSYRGRQVVKDVDLAVHSGEVVGLLGPNGAGKTTSFYMIVGLVQPESGQVMLDDTDITKLPMYQRARRGISYLPQEPSVFRHLTVAQNLLAILELRGLSARECRNRKDQLLEDERRRVEIARALVLDPAFILLDEPFAGIDPIAVIDIQNVVLALRERDIGILISDHNVRETLGVCDRAYILNEGTILESGGPDEIAASPRARAIYLGEKFRL